MSQSKKPNSITAIIESTIQTSVHLVRWPFLVTGAVWVVIALVAGFSSITVADLTRDVVQLAGLPYYAGLLSQVGILLWGATVTTCIFSASLLRNAPERPDSSRYLLSTGILTTILFLDDSFLLHEVLETYFGIASVVVFSIYLVLIGLYVVVFRQHLLSCAWPIALVALGFFGISAIVDAGVFSFPSLHYLIEDGSKFFGIVSWAVFCVHSCWVALQLN